MIAPVSCPSALILVANQFCNAECKVKRLTSVQTWVAHGFVTCVEIIITYSLCAPKTFGDVVSGEFDMNATWPCAFCAMRENEASDFTNDVVEVAGLATIWCGECVGVHWIACPHNRVPCVAHSTKQGTQCFFNIVCTHASDQRESAWDARWVECLAQVEHKINTCVFANFATNWIAYATKKLNVRSVKLTRAFADPQHVCTAVIPTASQ